MVLSSPP
jgi:hypothetical protein